MTRVIRRFIGASEDQVSYQPAFLVGDIDRVRDFVQTLKTGHPDWSGSLELIDATSIPTNDSKHLLFRLMSCFPKGAKKVAELVRALPESVIESGGFVRYLNQPTVEPPPRILFVLNMDALLIAEDGTENVEGSRLVEDIAFARDHLARNPEGGLLPALILFHVSERGMDIFRRHATDTHQWMNTYRLET